MGKTLFLLLAAAGMAACGPTVEYAYRPAEQATALLAGRPAARYGVPPEAPRGSVRVATFGIAEIEQSEGGVHALHVRLRIANNNDSGPWEMDARTIRVAYRGGRVAPPEMINTSGREENPSNLSIAPGQAITVDGYFALPPGAEGAGKVPRFDVLWEITTPERDVAERTPFERICVEPEVATATPIDIGPIWWFDPFFYPVPPVIMRPRVYVRAWPG